jgi:UDPglucose 6-dehydrogenase
MAMQSSNQSRDRSADSSRIEDVTDAPSDALPDDLPDDLPDLEPPDDLPEPHFSFLLPTRERVELCKTSLLSLADKCKNIRSFEVLFAFDDDDETSRKELPAFCDDMSIQYQVLVTKRYGYAKLHAYVNKLSAIARGSRLWLWNDDALMETDGWDDIMVKLVAMYPGHVWDFKTNWFRFTFPLVPKKYVDCLGHYSLNPHNDTWMMLIFQEMLQLTAVTSDISVFHNRGDESNKMGIDYAAIDRAYTEVGQPDLWSDFGKTLRVIDANRIIRTFLAAERPQLMFRPSPVKRIGFVGLGKLGLPVAAGIAARGHMVLGYDTATQNEMPVFDEYETPADVFASHHRAVELGPDGAPIDEFLRGPGAGVKFTTDLAYLVEFAELIFVAVQTPHEPMYEGTTRLPRRRANFDYGYLEASLKAIDAECQRLQKPTIVVVISTVLPGTMRTLTKNLSEFVQVAYNPYFIAMGTVLKDFYEPEFVLLGCDGERGGDRLAGALRAFYGTICPAPVFATSMESAEVIKVSYNTFISMKVAFANQLMEICDKLPGANVDDVTTALKMSGRRIVSQAYMTAGMGDGGGCHPRDNIAMSWLAKELDLKFDFCDAVMQAREAQTEYLADLVVDEARRTGLPVVVLGRAFKPNIKLDTGSCSVLLANLIRERVRNVQVVDPVADGDNEKSSDVEQMSAAVFVVATKHDVFGGLTFPAGSVVLDPHRYVRPQPEGVSVIYVGKRPR